jgi:tetratricopeptide (TPR) repeat protein
VYDLGEALMWVGEAQPAFDAFDTAVRLASGGDDRSLEWLSRIRRSAAVMLTDPHAIPTQRFRSELEEAARTFEKIGDEAALATIWRQLAELEWMPCRYERAAVAARRSLEHARRSGDPRLVESTLGVLIAASMFGVATPDEGIRELDELEPEISRSRVLGSFAMAMRASYVAMRGDFAGARGLIARSDEIVKGLGLGFMVSSNQEELGALELHAADPAAAERAFRENYTVLDALGDEGHKSTAAGNLARALCELGRFDEAEGYAEEAMRIAAEDDLASQTGGRSARARVRAARGEFAEAEQLAREAVELFADAQMPNFQADGWMDLAKVLRMAGKALESEGAAREALALYKRKGNRPASAATRAFIEELSSGT